MKKGICDNCGRGLDVAFGLNTWLCAECAMTAVIDKDIALKAAQKSKLIDFNLFSKQCYDIAEKNGFFEFENGLMLKYDFSSYEMDRLRMIFFTEIISHAVSEHSELFEALRNNRKADIKSFIQFDLKNDEKFYMAFVEYIKNTIQSELCDAIIILFGLAYKMGIDLNTQLRWNLKFNSLRLLKEGKRSGRDF